MMQLICSHALHSRYSAAETAASAGDSQLMISHLTINLPFTDKTGRDNNGRTAESLGSRQISRKRNKNPSQDESKSSLFGKL